MSTKLTFAEFKATGRDVADLRGTEKSEFHDPEAYPNPAPGRLYADDRLYLEASGEQWFFEWGHSDLTGDLAACEVELYGCYLAECADDNVSDYLLDIAPAARCNPKPADGEASLVKLLNAFCAFHGLTPRCANELSYEVTDAEQLRWLRRYCLRWDSTVHDDEFARQQLETLGDQ